VPFPDTFDPSTQLSHVNRNLCRLEGDFGAARLCTYPKSLVEEELNAILSGTLADSESRHSPKERGGESELSGKGTEPVLSYYAISATAE
jgi:hypothetical protein